MTDDPVLKIVLYAGDVPVATSFDKGIWLTSMASITGAQPVVTPAGLKSGVADQPLASGSHGNTALAKFAAELEVSVEALIGACSPSDSAPFIHLDHKYWESLKQNTPPRGIGSIPGVVLAATLLGLWARHSSIGKVSPGMADAVLKTIGIEEKNRARSLKGCEWLQVREDGIRINPASVPAAIKIAAAYVQKTPPK